ncbi:Protein N-terminal glutamine amidohydrolase [Blastocladiella emersonii ATCC 22665]|nr:Protein N-terminal glutamine amidohydrolase [Blastocladiella emersonii ATCC 22665]
MDRERRKPFTYTACYCEENVHRLLDEHLPVGSVPPHAPGEFRVAEAFAVFISNASKAVPLWHHWDRDANAPVVVCWDYHVIAIAVCRAPTGAQIALVYDLDSYLPFPCRLFDYATYALLASSDGSPPTDNPAFTHAYRVVPRAEFLATFSSDRRHMRAPDGSGGWTKQPPPYPPLRGPDAATAHDLDRFVGMVPGAGPGEVLDQAALLRRFGVDAAALPARQDAPSDGSASS